MFENEGIKVPTTVGDKLTILRKQMFISRGVVAKSVGADPSQIYAWETGRSKPNWQNTKRLAAFYKVNPVWLRSGVGEMHAEDSVPCASKAQGRQRVAELLAMSQLPQQLQELVLNAVDDLVAIAER